MILLKILKRKQLNILKIIMEMMEWNENRKEIEEYLENTNNR